MDKLFAMTTVSHVELLEYGILCHMLLCDEAIFDQPWLSYSLKKGDRLTIWDELIQCVHRLIKLQQLSNTVSVSVTEKHGHLDGHIWGSRGQLAECHPHYQHQEDYGHGSWHNSPSSQHLSRSKVSSSRSKKIKEEKWWTLANS